MPLDTFYMCVDMYDGDPKMQYQLCISAERQIVMPPPNLQTFRNSNINKDSHF